MGTTEVTQKQFEEVMGYNPSAHCSAGDRAGEVSGVDTSDFPVEAVSWIKAEEFCNRLSAKAGRNYRLPTEAEWEYACRAGTTTPFHCGDNDVTVETLEEYAWFTGNGRGRTHGVGQLKPNGWGLYDMHGNVKEWCSDWYVRDYVTNSPTDDPTGPSTAPSTGLLPTRVRRGGSWDTPASDCRSAHRESDTPNGSNSSLGFRVAKVPVE